MLPFKVRQKPEYPEKSLSKHGIEPTTNSTHMWRQHLDLNLGHSGRRHVLGLLHHPSLPCCLFKRPFKQTAGIQKWSTHWSHLPSSASQELDTATQPITHQFLIITTLMHCVWICRWRWRWWAFAVWIRCGAKRMHWRGVRQLGRPAKQMERCHPSTKAASWACQKGDKSRFHNFHLLNPQ